jgi:hypothetical protein
MLSAPASDQLEVDGAKVHVTLDHTLVNSGDTVKLSFESDKRVSLGIVVLGSSGTEGSRVPGPPRGVAHESVTVEPHETQVVSVKLHGAVPTYQEGGSPLGTYSIFVLSETAGDRLALLQRRAGPNIPTGEIPDQDEDTGKLWQVIHRIGSDDIENHRDARMFGAGRVAKLEAYTRPINHAIEIAAPQTAVVDRAFPVAVTLTNPRQHPMTLRLSLEFPAFDLGLAAGLVTADSSETITLGPRATRTIQLHVTAKSAGIAGLQTNVECVTEGDGCKDVFDPPAFEATEIKSAQPAVAAK